MSTVDMHRFDPVICAIDFGGLAPQVIGAARPPAHAGGGDLRVVHVTTAYSAGRADATCCDPLRAR